MPRDSDGERPPEKFRNHLFRPCSSFSELDFEDQIRTCPECQRFYFRCCHCRDTNGKPCHEASVVFTDGACSNNGQDGASAGYGYALGSDEPDQYSGSMKKFKVKTSQRAELVGAWGGLRKAIEGYKLNERTYPVVAGGRTKSLVILSDSQYVVKGITEWLAEWKSNGYKTADGKEPTNLDLFLRLEKLIKKYETDEFHIGFMHIRRKHNTLADKLAKRGAEADKPPVSSSSAGLEELGKQMRKMKV
ncbi:ribonuclease H-like domain-containing protein [Phyllosticta capitalensis]